jgi:hypothetical protein
VTAYTRRAIFVIPAAQQARCNELATQFDPDGGAATFTIPLNASGSPQDPPAFYWCAVAMREQTWQAAQQLLPEVTGARAYPWDMDADPDLPQQVLAELGVATAAPAHPEVVSLQEGEE